MQETNDKNNLFGARLMLSILSLFIKSHKNSYLVSEITNELISKFNIQNHYEKSNFKYRVRKVLRDLEACEWIKLYKRETQIKTIYWEIEVITEKFKTL